MGLGTVSGGSTTQQGAQPHRRGAHGLSAAIWGTGGTEPKGWPREII